MAIHFLKPSKRFKYALKKVFQPKQYQANPQAFYPVPKKCGASAQIELDTFKPGDYRQWVLDEA